MTIPYYMEIMGVDRPHRAHATSMIRTRTFSANPQEIAEESNKRLLVVEAPTIF